MRSRDGLKLIDHASFTDDVEGQIARGKLRLGAYEDAVRQALPHIEAALGAAGFTFEHSGLGRVARGQLAVVRLDGLLYRLGIGTAAKWTPAGAPPMLFLDSQWGGTDAARGFYTKSIGITPETTPGEIRDMLEVAADVLRHQTRSRQPQE